MSKYGSAQAKVFLVDGFSLLAAKVKEIRYKIISEREETTGAGDAYKAFCPTGVQSAELAQSGAFFDTNTDNIHDEMSVNQGVVRVVCLGLEDNIIGRGFIGFEGAFAAEYEVLSEVKALTKANVTYDVTGDVDANGLILHELSAETADDDTEDESVDNLASSANGGVGYLQIEAMTLGGYTNVVIALRDSTDDITFADLATFTAATARTAERITFSGTVERYLAVSLTFTGAGSGQSCNYFAGAVRN